MNYYFKTIVFYMSIGRLLFVYSCGYGNKPGNRIVADAMTSAYRL